MNKLNSIFGAMQKLHSDSMNFVCITLIASKGSAPQDIGAKALVSKRGLEFGTIGGGKVENHAIQFAQKMIHQDVEFSKCDWNLQKDIGMSCGGTVEFFFELFRLKSTFNIVVFGAGHIAQQFIPLALNLDCHITCFDSREEWISKLPNHPNLKKIWTQNPNEQVSNLPPNSFVTIMTMGHATDLPILIEVMKSRQNFSYVGVIGSETKRKRLESDLTQAGIVSELRNSFNCPMGENFGSNSPVEISFSIIAQLLKFRDQIVNKKCFSV